jgi:hypothetical protein
MGVSKIRRAAAITLTLAGLFLFAPVLPAQTLANPRWAGSGISNDPWWHFAVIYEIDPLVFSSPAADNIGAFASIAQRLGYLQSLHIDAILLAPLKLLPASGSAPPALDPAYGPPSGFDDLLQQASRRGIRVLVDLPLTPSQTSASLTSLARFWLSRGVAGLRLTQAASTGAPILMTRAQVGQSVAQLRPVAASFVGQRVLITDPDLGVDGTSTPTPASAEPATRAVRTRRRQAASPTLNAASAAIPTQLTLIRSVGFPEHLTGAALHQALASLSPAIAPVFFTDATGQPRALTRYGDGKNDAVLARLLATILLTSRSAAILYSGQELGLKEVSGGAPEPSVAAQDHDPKSLLTWYRTLTELRHDNPALSTGSISLLDTGNPDVVAWLRKPAAGNPVVVLCNLSAEPAQVSLTAALHSGFLRFLIPSVTIGTFTPTAPVSAIPLAPYGVFIGELRH